MTPQDDTILYPPISENEPISFLATPAPGIAATQRDTRQANSAHPHDSIARRASGAEHAQTSRADALPILPQSPSRLPRRWHLTADGEPMPVSMWAHLSPPQPVTPATQWRHALSAPHVAQTDTLSLAAQMMAQESPITEQGPPTSTADSPWINGAPGSVIAPSLDNSDTICGDG